MTALERSYAWWLADKNKKHDRLWSWLQYISVQTRTQRMDTRIFVEAVANFNPTGNSDFSYALRASLPYKIRDNILQAGRDTAVSRIAQSRTVPQYLTAAGDWSLSRVAEHRSRVLQGQFYALDVFRLVPRAFADACEGGLGAIYGCVEQTPRGPRPKLERCLHNEIYVDPEDGRYGDPMRMARARFVLRDELIEQYPGKKSEIELAAGPTSQDFMDFFIRRDSKADIVRVVEAWSRPATDGGSGHYVKCLSNVTLEDRPYKRRRLPIVRVLFAERAQGFYGQSLTERMLPAQLRLCEIDDFIARIQRLGSNSKWLVFRNSGVTRDDITNAPDQVLEVSEPGLAPQHVTYTGTPPDLAQQRREIKDDVFSQEGFGDNTPTGDVNKGLSSARAVRAADDVKSQRFISPMRLLEFAYMDLTRLIEDLNDECAEIDPEYSPEARYRSGKRTWLKRRRWVDLGFGDDEPQVRLFPISAQATTPQGKWSEVQEWIDDGFVSKPMAMDLMEFPDTEAFEQLDNADLDLVREQVDNIIDLDGAREDMLLPIASQDLALAKYVANQAYKVAFRLGAPDDVLMRFDRYLARCKQLEDDAAANQQPSAPEAPAPAALGPNAAAAAQLTAGQPAAQEG